MTGLGTTQKTPIPPTIKRNTLFLTLNQALFSGVFQSAMVIAALGVFFFTQSAALGSLASAVAIGGRILVAYGAGRLMDRFGRKVVLYLGVAVTCSALVLMAWALNSSQLVFFWLGIFAFGTGAGIMNLIKVAIMDMYPGARRGEGMGYLLTGSVVGTFAAPLLSYIVPFLAFIGLGTYVLILLISVPLMALSAVFIKLVKPDTREIVQDLARYYPSDSPPAPAASQGRGPPASTPAKPILTVPVVGAFIASAFSWGGMVMGMSIVSIILQQYGVSLTMINIAVSLHVFGMFGLSVPMGWLTDRYGRRFVTALGGIILGAGALIMPLTPEYWMITFGVFLIGLGWSATNVATTALLCDLTPSHRRGSILGANDVVTGLTSVSLPVVGGAILASSGLLAFGVAGVVVAAPVVLGVLPVRERSPGRYDI